MRDQLIDLFFPHAEKLPADELAKHQNMVNADVDRVGALPDDKATIEACLHHCENLLETERNRRAGVETRLSGMLGLASVASTILFGSMLIQATGGPGIQSMGLRAAVAVGALYVVSQIALTVLAATRGLERRGYEALGLEDLVAQTGETENAYLRRRASRLLTVYWQHDWENNEKLTQMAVAHRAMKNFIWGVLVLALVFASFSIRKRPGDDVLIQRLKSDHELRQLLTGPAGPQGPQGLAGPKGDTAALPGTDLPAGQRHRTRRRDQ